MYTYYCVNLFAYLSKWNNLTKDNLELLRPQEEAKKIFFRTAFLMEHGPTDTLILEF